MRRLSDGEGEGVRVGVGGEEVGKSGEGSGEKGGGGGGGGEGGGMAGVKGLCDELHGDRWCLVLSKSQLDKACKDKQHKLFPPDFKLELVFAHVH